MGTLPSIPGIIRIELDWAIESDDMAMNRFYWGYTGTPPDTTTCADLASAISTAVGANLPGMFRSSISQTQVRVTDLSSMSSGDAYGGSVVVGTRDGGELPPGAAANLNFTVNRRYRGGKPRIYTPWGTSADLASTGLWSEDFAGDAGGAYASFAGQVATISNSGTVLGNQYAIHYYSGYTLGPASAGGYRKKIPTPLAVPITDQVISVACSTVVGSQRRRNRDA